MENVRSLGKAVLLSFCGIVLVGGIVHAGESICPLVADTTIYSYHSEQRFNMGASSKLKIKGKHEMPLMNFDLSGIPKGSVVTKAVLTLTPCKSESQLNQIGFSTMPTAWVEGIAGDGDVDSVCFAWPGGVGNKWGGAGLGFCDIFFGNGGNVTGYTFAKKSGTGYEIEISPRAIEAMRVDQSGGLVVMDESGAWETHARNIYLYSREAGSKGKGPQLTVSWERAADKVSPSMPGIVLVDKMLEDGELLLEITCGGNDGTKGIALGYDIKLKEGGGLSSASWKQAESLPRYRIPRPKANGDKIRVWIRDLDPGKVYSVGIVAYDEAGNRSKLAVAKPATAAGPTKTPSLGAKDFVVKKGSPLKIGSSLKVWALDELTEVEPVSGKVLGGKGYVESDDRNGNHVWNGEDKKVELFGVKGETVSFRLVLENGGATALKGLKLDTAKFVAGSSSIAGDKVDFRRDWYLKVKSDWTVSVLPELNGKNNGLLDIPMTDQGIAGQKLQTVLVEINVPEDAMASIYEGAINISGAGIEGKLPVSLKVYDVVMPKELGFIIELNAYGADKHKEKFQAIHRLAHEFRLGYNVCPYGHSGHQSVQYIPKIVGKGAAAKIEDWSAWDEWMGPLLDGSLFKDLPRGAVPIPHQYLPFFENYPVTMAYGYRDGKLQPVAYEKATGKKWNKKEWVPWFIAKDGDIVDGFNDDWKAGAKKIAGDFRKHFESKGWTKTEFQIFCNNKNYKGNPAVSLWVLDEPNFGRDFRALDFLYSTFKEPFEGSKLNVTQRGDVSRPQWQGDRMDKSCDYYVVSSAIYSEQNLLQKRMMEKDNRYWFYGGSPGPAVDMAQLEALYLKNWGMGAVGGLAYWTSFSGDPWDDAKSLGCVAKHRNGYSAQAIPTDRIAAQRRAQQDMELLDLLSAKDGWSQKRVARALASAVNLASKTVATNADDPGSTSFREISAADLARIRLAVVRQLIK